MSAIILGVVGPEVFIVQPGFVQGLVQYLGFDEQQAGYVASAEMAGIAVTTVLLTFIAHRVGWRGVVIASLLTMAGANIASTFITDFSAFASLRFVAGLGAGGLVSLSFAAIGLTRDPDRNFGYMIMWVLIYGAIALWLMPSVYAQAGMNGALWFFALFPLLALAVVPYFPAGGPQASADATAVEIAGPLKVSALLAMFAYFLAQGVVWAYLFLIGLGLGLAEQEVANGLTLSQFAGIAGAFLAAVLGARWGRLGPLALGILGGAICLYFLTGAYVFALFAVVVGIYNFAWNLTHPYLLAAMASFDTTGKVVVYAVAMQMVGLALGPFLAATVVGDAQYDRVLLLGGALFVVSAVLIFAPVVAQAKRQTQVTTGDA